MRSGPIIFSTKIELEFPCTLRQHLQLFLEIIACYFDNWHRLVSQISFFCIDLTRLTVSPCRICLFVYVFIIRNGQIRFLLNKSLNHRLGSRFHWYHDVLEQLIGLIQDSQHIRYPGFKIVFDFTTPKSKKAFNCQVNFYFSSEKVLSYSD